MKPLKGKLVLSLLALAVIGFGSATSAKADIIQFTPAQLQGQGLGSTTTALTLQSPGNSTTETGGITPAGTFGDAMTGASQTQLFTFGSAGITSASNLRLIVNLNEPNSENPPSVNFNPAAGENALVLAVFAATGNSAAPLATFNLAASLVGAQLNQQASGIGGSGLVFGLDATQAAQLQALINGNANLRLGVSASFTNAQGGIDAIQVANATNPQVIPEPATMILLGTGLAGVAAKVRRRRKAE